jgi:hypothetical protein
MNKYVLAALLCSNFAPAAQGNPASPAGPPADSPERSSILVGAYVPAPLDAALVLEAKAYVQKHLASMNLGEVTEAYTQVVAGLNIKVVCSVTADDGPSSWQFVVYQTLDGKYHLYSADRL